MPKRHLQEENTQSSSNVEDLAAIFNNFEQYGRHSKIEVLRILDSLSDNVVKYLAIKAMKAIEIEVANCCDTVAYHRIRKWKGNLRKAIASFRKRKNFPRTLYDIKYLSSINTSVVGLGNNIKLFIMENLADQQIGGLNVVKLKELP